jgi:hypothetical protein
MLITLMVSLCLLLLLPTLTMNINGVCELLQAMDGSMNLEQALEERLRIINCTPADIKRFIKAHPPESRLVPVSETLEFCIQYTCCSLNESPQAVQ